jgi:hypothetical protein
VCGHGRHPGASWATPNLGPPWATCPAGLRTPRADWRVDIPARADAGSGRFMFHRMCHPPGCASLRPGPPQSAPRSRVVPQSQIRRPNPGEYHGGHESEGYAAAEPTLSKKV